MRARSDEHNCVITSLCKMWLALTFTDVELCQDKTSKVVILLGEWDTASHLLWISNNPKKRPASVGLRKSVSSVCSFCGVLFTFHLIAYIFRSTPQLGRSNKACLYPYPVADWV